ncbi:MAG: MipA/OmpV family protein [Maricaulaceae bacterium]
MRNKKILETLSVAALAVCVSSAAYGQTVDNTERESDIIYFGAAVVSTPEYLGADDDEVLIIPYLEVSDYKGFDFFGTQLSYRLLEAGTGQGIGKWSLRAGPSVTYQRGRDSDDSDTLTGLEDVDGSLPIGGYIRSTFGPVGFRVDAGQDVIGGHDGLSVDASIGTSYDGGKFGIQPSATLSWGNGNYNESFFGITDEQSTASGLSAFDIGSGFNSYSFNVIAWYQILENYQLGAFASYKEFFDDAEDSPIIQAEDGSTNGLTVGLSLTRKFDISRF